MRTANSREEAAPPTPPPPHTNHDGDQEEEQQELFYESLDRILSSSCSSTSASDDDGEAGNARNHRRVANAHRSRQSPSSLSSVFPVVAAPGPSYDVWLATPSSVEERRRCLLQKLGLIGDPALARRQQPGPGASAAAAATDASDSDDGGGSSSSCDGLYRRSVSCDDGLYRKAADRQERGGDSNPNHDTRTNHDLNNTPNSPLSAAANIARSRSDGSVYTDSNSVQLAQCTKPPLAKSASSGTEADHNDDDSGVAAPLASDDPYCTIKNLDNGEEFVVKEVREDGMWNKLSEVGTDRTLTMEEFQVAVAGYSPIVMELMRRQQQSQLQDDSADCGITSSSSASSAADMTESVTTNGGGPGSGGMVRHRRRGSWLTRSIRNLTWSSTSPAGAIGTVGGDSIRTNASSGSDRRSSDEKDTSSEKGGRRSSSATDDSQDVLQQHSTQPFERVKVRHYGKSCKELTGLYLNQEIQAHYGSIWTVKFSHDGRYLATAGEDCVIHVWQVVESEKKRDWLIKDKGGGGNHNQCPPTSSPFSSTYSFNGSPEPHSAGVPNLERENSDKRRRTKVPSARKSLSFDNLVMPAYVFALSEKPVCSFRGHDKDVLDLSWSKSEQLLSSSMDKTVKLWDMSSNSCLKTFSHSDYVTCIQFNPVDDNYFISGSLDAKVRLWSIEQRQVVDWSDLHEMVTAVCYTPDGQGAFVGSHKGSCNFFHISGHKLQQKKQINLQNRKKKSHLKKITGFQFAPGSTTEVIITSADSRLRVVDDMEMVHKFKGFRNTTSQISASITADGRHMVCASEDSHVYMWGYDSDSRPSRSKGVIPVTQSYENFHCRDVSVAVVWPGNSIFGPLRSNSEREHGGATRGHPASPLPAYEYRSSPRSSSHSPGNGNIFSDRSSATWPEEKLVAAARKWSPRHSVDFNELQSKSAWGMVIVTAGRGGEIRAFQNFGYPFRV